MKHVKKGILFFAGWFFVLLGLVGLVTPFLQGILFIILGIYILSIAHKPLGEKIEKYMRRFPAIDRICNRRKERKDSGDSPQ